MKISYNWLKEYVPVKYTPEKLAEVLSLHAVEVETVKNIGGDWQGVVVGEIKEIKPHPNADKVKIALVDIGQKRPRQIVFGAQWPLQVGKKLPVAVAPAQIPAGKIEKRKMRGILSEGMLCVDAELGLAPEEEKDKLHTTYFDKAVKNGTPLARALAKDDYVLDVDVLPNRPDLLSHWGVAREVAAIQTIVARKKTAFKPPAIKELPALPKAKTLPLTVQVQDKKLCPRYQTLVISDVSVGESPQWLKGRLEAVGLKPINNITDITNFVMFETGQPLHAFDYDKVNGAKIIVRKARKGESLLTLADDRKRDLTPANLVIADAGKPLAVAGVVGGEDSAVTSSTKAIIIESACFDPVSVRKTAQALNLRTDAVTRFEKKIDQSQTKTALLRCAGLIALEAGGKAASRIFNVGQIKNPASKIKVDPARLGKLVGTEVKLARVKKILAALGCKTAGTSKTLTVTPPAFRRDMEIFEDVIEEVARLYGYDRIPARAPEVALAAPALDDKLAWIKKTKETLEALGFTEVYNYAFTNYKIMKRLGLGDCEAVEVLNPMSRELEILKSTLVPGIMANLSKAVGRPEFDRGQIFEISKVFYPPLERIKEQYYLTGAIAVRGQQELFSEIKGVVEQILAGLGYRPEGVKFIKGEKPMPYYQAGRVGGVEIRGEFVGALGEIGQVKNNFNLGNFSVASFDLDIEKLIAGACDPCRYKKPVDFPQVTRDFNMNIRESVEGINVAFKAHDLGPRELIRVSFKVEPYMKDTPVGYKKITLHSIYQSPDRTLTDKEVNRWQNKVEKGLKAAF